MDLNPIEMLWHDLKQSFHARKPSNVAELKQFCKEEWATIPLSDVRLIVIYCKHLIAVVAQPVIRFDFHIEPGSFFALIN